MAICSLLGTAAGVFVGIKVALAKIEMWRDIAAEEIRELRKDVGVLEDDSLIYDGEIDLLYNNSGLRRAVRPRQRIR